MQDGASNGRQQWYRPGDLAAAGRAGRGGESHSRRLAFENLEGERHYNFFDAYARSKLANILFTYELARRLQGSRVTANCFTPGPTATNFGRGAGGLMGVMSRMVHFLALTPLGSSAEKGALPAVYLASEPGVAAVSGAYFVRLRPSRSKPVTYNGEVAARLWTVSEQLTNPGPEITQRALEVHR